MDKNTGLILTEKEHILQSVEDILLTQKGTRLLRREYGSDIPLLIARPINQVLFLQLASNAIQAIKKWESRISISSFKPELTENGITVSMTYSTNKNQTYSINNLRLN